MTQNIKEQLLLHKKNDIPSFIKNKMSTFFKLFRVAYYDL